MSRASKPSETTAAAVVGDKGPYLIIAAFWQATDDTDAVAEALRESNGFPTPEGYSRGAVVAFRHEVADSLLFRHDLGRFNLEELNERPATTTTTALKQSSPSPASRSVPD
jgi:hypothetical protein